MIAPSVIMSLLGPAAFAATVDSTTICVRDGETRMPLSDVQMVDSDGAVRLLASSCTVAEPGVFVVRRIGYRSRQIEIDSATRLVYLYRTASARLLPLHIISASASTDERGMNAESAVARTAASVDVNRERSRGVHDAVSLVAALPFASATNARGELGLNLRGARSNGVAVTLDGMPLNDPSTGIANVSELPLVLLRSATVVLGTDPLGFGSGASGGVLALHSAAARAASTTVGSYGSRSLEASWSSSIHERLAYGAASFQSATNDFIFRNSVAELDAAPPAFNEERRVNNDNQTIALAVGMLGAQSQSMLVASSTERGMVGPINVHAYDKDRSRASKLMLRSQFALRSRVFSGGIRGFELRYRDPARPVMDAHSRSLAADVETGGIIPLSSDFSWRLGLGGDLIRGSGNISQTRTRAFLSSQKLGRWGANLVEIGARIDGVKTLGLLPSFSTAIERVIARGNGSDSLQSFAKIGVRASQSVRVPTLYDLYFSSPQRIFVRTLSPERVAFDVELNSDAQLVGAVGSLTVHAAIVARDTRDAIVWFPGNFGWSPANVGRERVRGVEARASFDHSHAAISGWMTAYRTDLSVESLHIPTPYIPRVSAGFRSSIHNSNSEVGGSFRFTGSRPFTVGPRTPDFELAATSLLGLFASHRFEASSQDTTFLRRVSALVVLSLDNATDVSWQSVQGFPSPGRSWTLSVTINPASHP